MFTKILIANRGEIACRIMRTAKAMGVKTVAVYSDADKHAMHVREADESCHIGPSTAALSYLNIDNIIAAAKKCGAQAIHPGYGFLSENPDFVEAVEAAGLIFIGPSVKAIRAMGLKDAAKKLMERAGVPVVPGYHGENQEPGFLAQQAEKIGFPVLIKARAGGGGKGMRLVEKAEDFAAGLAGAVREGEASFGDGHVLIEKYISSPRHIEIQVFGDAHGDVVHMFERDCSLQRRHQKVIEEAPAPGMSDEMRAAMGAAAVKAAKAVDYCGAGTVEFIVDGTGVLSAEKFWFMEMNTRLQVEHPVTEMITGLDLVELQLKVASGEPLGFTQDDLAIDGWAFEARIYAEDAIKGFLPCTGALDYFDLPHHCARIDSGVGEGDEISPHYDPMIAKVIVHGGSREVALQRLSEALTQCHIAGVTTNTGFVYGLSVNDDFRNENVDTGLIERKIDSLLNGLSPCETDVAVGAWVALNAKQKLAEEIGHQSGWRHWGAGSSYVDLRFEDKQFSCGVMPCGEGRFTVDVEGHDIEIKLLDFEDGNEEFLLAVNEIQHNVIPFVSGCDVTTMTNANSFRWQVIDWLEATVGEEETADAVFSPMPGLVKIIHVKIGDEVKKGQPLVVLEAMKMEHSLSAPRDGEIENINAEQGAQIDDGSLLIQLRELAKD